MRSIIILLPSVLMAISLGYAHSGGRDKPGCHHNHREGVYHCHRGELQGKEFASKADAQAALDAGSAT